MERQITWRMKGCRSMKNKTEECRNWSSPLKNLLKKFEFRAVRGGNYFNFTCAEKTA